MASKTPAKKKIADRQKIGNLFQLPLKKDESLLPGNVKVLWRRADLGRRKSSSAELSWDEGKKVVELAVLAEGLRAYEDCKNPLQLFNIVSEKRHGLGSLLNFICSCAVNWTPFPPKSHINQLAQVRFSDLTSLLNSLNNCKTDYWWRRASKMSAPSTSGLSVVLLLRVMDVK